jgi:hypothetical protein
LLFQGKELSSRFIRWGSASDYSHCGIVAWWGERLMVFESVRRGARLVPASLTVDRYDGRVDWWSVRPAHRPVPTAAILAEAMHGLSTPFSTGGIAWLAWRILLGRYRGTGDAKKRPPAMFCSQYVSRCYRVAGLDLSPDTADDCTSPGEIARSEVMMLRGILHRDPEERLADEPA